MLGVERIRQPDSGSPITPVQEWDADRQTDRRCMTQLVNNPLSRQNCHLLTTRSNVWGERYDTAQANSRREAEAARTHPQLFLDRSCRQLSCEPFF